MNHEFQRILEKLIISNVDKTQRNPSIFYGIWRITFDTDKKENPTLADMKNYFLNKIYEIEGIKQ